MNTAATYRVRVAARQLEAQDICSFELVSADETPLPPFSAGSHIDVHLAGGLIRQYSLCNDPAESHRYLIAVLREPASRGGSQAMHDQVEVGQILTISAPKNHFPLVPDARHSLLLAGGIGVTPILCMAQRLARVGAGFDMHYCSRSRSRTAFINRIEHAPFAQQVHFHFDDGAPDQKIHLPSLLSKPQAGTHLYVCGPKGFMDAVLSAARSAHWPESQIHFEFFAAEVQTADTDAPFEVELAGSGRVVVVGKDQTVIQALTEAGVEVLTSCEQGLCGTCLTRVLSGTPEHRDQYLTPDERAANDQFLPCCSRSKSARLVIDL